MEENMNVMTIEETVVEETQNETTAVEEVVPKKNNPIITGAKAIGRGVRFVGGGIKKAATSTPGKIALGFGLGFLVKTFLDGQTDDGCDSDVNPEPIESTFTDEIVEPVENTEE